MVSALTAHTPAGCRGCAARGRSEEGASARGQKFFEVKRTPAYLDGTSSTSPENDSVDSFRFVVHDSLRERKMSKRFEFDEAYYRRFYVDADTRAMSPDEFTRLGEFVAGYLRYLDQPVRHVLDLGCGMGYWRAIVDRHFPGASYTGVEVSPYLCERFGWKPGSAVDFRSRRRFDLVICSDVLQYLSSTDASTAIENLARLCDGALYFGALTKEDWAQNCDRTRTDDRGYLRSGNWYRRRLGAHFSNAGGGLFFSCRSPVVLYELEKLGRPR